MTNSSSCSDLIELQKRIRAFVNARDWEQFHSPKNLVMALGVEAAELAEHFLWLSQSESEKLPAETKAQVEPEIADVLIYVVMLADRLQIDLLDVASRKLLENEQKYPAEQVRGRAEKYSAYKTRKGA